MNLYHCLIYSDGRFIKSERVLARSARLTKDAWIKEMVKWGIDIPDGMKFSVTHVYGDRGFRPLRYTVRV
jgi:hypothetical protein